MFSYAIDEEALKQAELMDGKLMLVTNVADLTPPEVVQRYKALGVWAAEGFEKYSQNFDLSEWLRLHYFDVVKGSSTPENITF